LEAVVWTGSAVFSGSHSNILPPSMRGASRELRSSSLSTARRPWPIRLSSYETFRTYADAQGEVSSYVVLSQLNAHAPEKYTSKHWVKAYNHRSFMRMHPAVFQTCAQPLSITTCISLTMQCSPTSLCSSLFLLHLSTLLCTVHSFNLGVVTHRRRRFSHKALNICHEENILPCP
jgi:hypothetical protein